MPQDSTSEGRIIANTGWLLAGQAVAALLTLLQGVILARSLGVEGYGQWALVTATTLVVIQFFDFRVWEAVIRFVPHYRSRGDQDRATATVQLCFLLDLATALMAWGSLFLLAHLASQLLLKGDEGHQLFRLFALAALLNAPFETSSGLMRIAGRFDRLAFHRVVVALARTAATALCWWIEPTPRAMLAAHLCGTAAGIPVLIAGTREAARVLDLALLDWSRFSHLAGERWRVIRFALFTSLTGTSRIITTRADRLILGALATPAAVGIYDLAKTLVEQLGSLSNALYSAIFPEVSKLAAAGRFTQLGTLQKRISLWLGAGAIPGCLLLAAVAPWLLPTLFGPPFVSSVPVFQILVWRFLWLPLVWFPGLLLSLGRETLSTILAWSYATVLVALLVVLVPRGAAIGAAVADLVSLLFWCVLAVSLLPAVWRDIEAATESDPS